jgi:hypothetical protein
MTDDLIAHLAADLRPVRRTAMIRRLWLVALLALVVSAVLMLLWLGPRPDMAEAVGTPIFWIKSAYTLGLALLGLWAVERLSRPAESGKAPLITAVLLLAAVVAAAVVDYAVMPATSRETMLMGSSAQECPFYIMALSVPFLVTNVMLMRRLAPTNLTGAGTAAGLMAGALGAWVYSFHCTEPGLPFLASWYSLGIAAITALGAALGRFLLRW